jgi:fucose permease
MLIVYYSATLVNCLPIQTFSSINVAVERIFSISATEVTLNALLFNLAHPLFAFPCNWLLNRFGMHKCFILGGIFTIGGVWLRLLIQ